MVIKHGGGVKAMKVPVRQMTWKMTPFLLGFLKLSHFPLLLANTWVVGCFSLKVVSVFHSTQHHKELAFICPKRGIYFSIPCIFGKQWGWRRWDLPRLPVQVLYQKETIKTLQCHESLAEPLCLLHTLLRGSCWWWAVFYPVSQLWREVDKCV